MNMSRLSVQEAGNGTHLVFLHGFLENKEMWEGILPHFTDRFHCVTLDLPGHGGSPILPGIQSMKAMATAVLEELDQIGVDRFSLIGHSMGGYVGLEIARMVGQRLEGLCLYHSRVLNDPPEKREGRVRAVRAVAQGKTFFLRDTLKGLFGAPNQSRLSEVIDRLSREADSMSAEAIQSSLLGMRNRRNGTDIYGKIPHRLSILGEWDKAVPVEEEGLHLKAIGDEPYWLKKVGHMSHFEDTEQAVRAMEHFLSRVYKN